jgi:CotS family spore coat protein
MDNLKETVRRHYKLTPLEINPHGPVWRLQTTSGSFLLKKMKCSGDRLVALAENIQKLTARGFNGLTPLLFTKNGLPYFTFENQNYVITPWLSGDHPDFTHAGHLKQTAVLFGKLHRISQNILDPQTESICNPVDELHEKLTFLEKTAIVLQKTKKINRIDRSILHWADHFIVQGRFCLKELSHLEQTRLSNLFGIGFCHKDPAPRNIIIQNTGWILIDYELSQVDYFTTDMVTLLQRTLNWNQWERTLVDLIINSYSGERKLSGEEHRFILVSLCFPRQFWRLCSQRFEEKLDWTEKHYQSKFWTLYNEEPVRMRFLNYYFPKM